MAPKWHGPLHKPGTITVPGVARIWRATSAGGRLDFWLRCSFFVGFDALPNAAGAAFASHAASFYAGGGSSGAPSLSRCVSLSLPQPCVSFSRASIQAQARRMMTASTRSSRVATWWLSGQIGAVHLALRTARRRWSPGVETACAFTQHEAISCLAAREREHRASSLPREPFEIESQACSALPIPPDNAVNGPT